MKSEIQTVKEQTYTKLVNMGYDPAAVRKLVNTFWKVIGYYNGQPSRVLTVDGQEIFL